MQSIFRLVIILLPLPILLTLTILPAWAAPAPNRTIPHSPQASALPNPTSSPFAVTVTPVMTIYLPVVFSAPPTENWLAYVNHYRNLSGVPPVRANATLNDNCFQHARYMAENNHLTHSQNSSLPWASVAGQVCAQKGNAWMGGAFYVPYWQPNDSIDSWMGSAGHRLWMLYPTTLTFGYGFYTAGNNQAGAALDVLSRANFGADTSYPGWPVRYPAPNQVGVPATKYPIRLKQKIKHT